MKFSIRSLLAATTLVALFLMLSLLPLVRHRAARQTSMRLLSANATISKTWDWDNFYTKIDFTPPPKLAFAENNAIPAWLAPFTDQTEAIPPDNAVRSIQLNTDRQCQILAENWRRLPSLQSVSISPGVSTEGFRLLQDVLPRLKHLELVHTADVDAPSGWYRSLTNIRTLCVWGGGALRGTPFDKEHLQDIVALSNLEVLMVLGYAFDDKDARELSTSNSIARVMLHDTAVTAAGELDLANESRVVYRN